MGLRCRAGDLAIVLKAYCPENVGLFVNVIKLWGRNSDGAVEWITESRVNAPAMLMNGSMEVRQMRYAICRDDWMQPIRPPAPPESVDTLENVEAVA